MNTPSPLSSLSPQEEDLLYQKVTKKLVPLLLLSFVVAYLDRVNVGFAKLGMQRDLGHSDAVYGLGAGIFFLGYFLFEIPSNLLLARVGARLWLGRIMLTWGLISAATALVKTDTQFYCIRFLLGVAEAGFFPGVIFYLTSWFPSQRRARVTSLFMSGVAVAGVIGGPVSGWILKNMEGVGGHQAWQWLYVLEALPALLMAFVLFWRLDDNLESAEWLSAHEKQILTLRLEEERASKPATQSTWSFFRQARIWHMTLINFSLIMGLYGISFWMPTLIQHMGIADEWTLGLLTSLPWLAAIGSMLLVARRADHKRERRWHLAIPALIGAVGLLATVIWQEHHVLSFAALLIATMGIQTCMPLFWSLPTSILTGLSAAGAIAMINSLANLAGFFSPTWVGWLNQTTGNTKDGMFMLAGFLCLAAGLTLLLPAKLVNK